MRYLTCDVAYCLLDATVVPVIDYYEPACDYFIVEMLHTYFSRFIQVGIKA